MKRLMLNRVLAALALCAAVALPAQATIVDFEDVAPTLFSGSSESSGGFSFASSGVGFSGIDEAGAFVFGVAPPNSSGQFLFGLNGDVLTMTQSGGGSFRLLGLDASFLPPLPDLGAGLQAGQLHIEALTVGGLITADFDFGASDANGVWSFASFATDAMASGVTAVSFAACVYVYDINGDIDGCSFTDPLAQFAVDNIHVPEPGTAALALAALGILAARRRPQSL